MTSVAHKTTFNPNPVQKSFIESRRKADLFSSRMGEGKSTALSWAALYHTRHNPGAKWALIRDTYENLMGTTWKTFTEWFPIGVYGTWNAQRKTYTWASGIADGEVMFLGMDAEMDATKLMSRELGGFGIDEPAPAVSSGGVDEAIFNMALSRLRQQGMNWYAAKLAENNPDEAHWTYRRFVQPGEPEFALWQPQLPENLHHLPATYYTDLRSNWAGREDLVNRFVDGKFGFQRLGKSVTPGWNDDIHLATGLTPLPRQDVYVLWDFGLNPTAIFTQRTPLGTWLILDSMVGDGIGAEELIDGWAAPLYAERYKPLHCPLRHIGDPAGKTPEQSSSKRSAVRVVRQKLKGPFRAGPFRLHERVEPLRAVLAKLVAGRGLVQVDRQRAFHVWHALRGGWHHKIHPNGVTAPEPLKNIHSHPGDAMGYGAAVLYPMGRRQHRAGAAAGAGTGTGDSAGNPRDSRQPGGYFGDEGEALQSWLKTTRRVQAGPRHGEKLS